MKNNAGGIPEPGLLPAFSAEKILPLCLIGGKCVQKSNILFFGGV